MSSDAMGQAALAYALRGLRVFPVSPQTKHPLIPKEDGGRGYLDGTTNTDAIRAWWQRWPEAAIGVWPGPRGYLVVDIDGPAAKQHAETLGCYAEPTLTARTGRPEGGEHRWYQRPAGFPYVTNTTLGHDDVHIRCDAGYVIAPPSRHPSGRRYEWIDRTPAGVLPPLAVSALRTALVGSNGPGGPRKIPTIKPIPEGSRHTTLLRQAASLSALTHGRLSLEELFAWVQSVNVAWCSPTYSAEKVLDICRWTLEQELAGNTNSGPGAGIPSAALYGRPSRTAVRVWG